MNNDISFHSWLVPNFEENESENNGGFPYKTLLSSDSDIIV